MFDYWWLLCLIPLAAALFLMFSEGKQKKNKIKIRRLKRRLKNYEKGAEMSKIIDGLVGKRCRMGVYGEVKVIEADDEWIKFEYRDKRGNQAVKVLRIDELTEIDLLD